MENKAGGSVKVKEVDILAKEKVTDLEGQH
jgi:hypothetical protein